jgi:cobalamin biosynthesis Mg chelatase CobN
MNVDPLIIVIVGCFCIAVLISGVIILYTSVSAYSARRQKDYYAQAYQWALDQLSTGKISVTLLDARAQKRLRCNPLTAYDQGVLDALRDYSRAERRESTNRRLGIVR